MKFSVALTLGMMLFFLGGIIPLSAAPEKAAEQEKDNIKLKSGEWMPVLELGQNLFPAFALATATIIRDDEDSEDSDPRRIGDYWSNFGIVIRSPSENCKIKVEIAGQTYLHPSVIEAVLPQKDTVYWVFPPLKYNYEKLPGITQNIPETINFKVSINGTATPDISRTVQVRPVNDCVYAYDDALGYYRDTAEFFAAFVNENHPLIDKILQAALKSRNIESFAGYQKNSDGVMQEIEAIWDVLSHQEIRYSSITTTTGESEDIGCQHVRRLGESLGNTQANCVDGSVLLASILRKMGLNVSLVTLPDHMFVEVDLDKDGDEAVYIETTLLGEGSLSEALEAGLIQYEVNEEKFKSEKKEDWDYQLINIAEAREMGIMPIKD